MLAANERGLKNLVDAAANTASQYINEKGSSEKESIDAALQVVRGMKFEGDNYLFVFDKKGLMLVSADASSENVPMWDTKDQHGNVTSSPT